MAESKKNYFAELNAINVSGKTEKKNGLTYLSWAWAWGEIKKIHPDTTYTIYEDSDGKFYHTDGKTCWVKTGVTCNGIENIEYLPVMDHRNQPIPLSQVTSTAVNKAIQRSLTKAVARHGLGLYIYAGEDLPEEDTTADIPDVEEVKAPEHPNAEQVYQMSHLATSAGMTAKKLEVAYQVDSLGELTMAQYEQAMKRLRQLADKRKEPKDDGRQMQMPVMEGEA